MIYRQIDVIKYDQTLVIQAFVKASTATLLLATCIWSATNTTP